MLIYMENERKIFKNWLYKTIKIDKIITGKKLAELIGCHPSTITSYINGRTGAEFKIRQKILEVTNTTHREMMEAGRKELPPPQDTNLEKIIDDRVKTIVSQIGFSDTVTAEIIHAATPEKIFNTLKQLSQKDLNLVKEFVDRLNK